MGTPTEQSFKNLAQAMAMNMLEDCYERVYAEEAPFDDKLDFLKLTAKLGDLEPRPANAPQGTNFSIKVVYGGSDERVGAATVTIDGGEADQIELGETPAYLAPSPATRKLGSLVFTTPQEA